MGKVPSRNSNKDVNETPAMKRRRQQKEGKRQRGMNNNSSGLQDVTREITSKDAKLNATHHSRTNPAEWYIPDNVLLRNVASIPFTNAIGNQMSFGEYGQNINDNAIPGIMTLTVANAFGYNDNDASPMNMTFRNLWSFLGQANSRNKTYDANTLGLYILAMDSAHSVLAWMRRIYGCLQLTNVFSRYVPKALLISMGIDYDDIVEHAAQFRYMINNYATRLAQLVTPANSALTRRHMWLYEGIYADHAIGKTQLYVIKPAGFHVYHVNDDGTAKLEFRALPYNTPSTRDYLMTYADVWNIAEIVLNSILTRYGEQDFDVISADILKAFGENAVYRAQLMPDDYSVMPVFDEHVLWQIANATCSMNRAEVYSEISDNYIETFSVSERVIDGVTSYLSTAIRKPKPAHGANADVIDRMINLPLTSPSPEDVIDATRLTVQGMVNNDVEEPYIFYPAMGSEFPMYCNTYRFQRSGSGEWVVHQGDDITFRYSTELNGTGDFPFGEQLERLLTFSDETAATMWHQFLSGDAVYGSDPLSTAVSGTATFNGARLKSFVEQMSNKVESALRYTINAVSELACFSTFDWHPLIWYNVMTRLKGMKIVDVDETHSKLEYNTTTTSVYASSFVGDITNTSIIKMNNLMGIHEVALQAQFGLTMFGKSIL